MPLSCAGVLVVGSLNMDHIVGVARLPAPGETVLSEHYATAPGGKGRNQAAAIAALGGTVSMAGAVGDDAAGSWLLADIDRRGIERSLVETLRGVSTGLALIAVDAMGENTIVVHSGANRRVGPISGDVMDRLGHRVLLCSLEIPLDSVTATVASARSRRITTVVNAAPMVGYGDGTLAAILEHTDFVIFNRSEAATLVGSIVRSGDGDVASSRVASRDLITAVESWRHPNGPCVIVTLGAEGAVYVDDDGAHALPAFAVDVQSTVGAGDTFAGAFCHAVALGHPTEDAAGTAGAAAAAFVSGELSQQRVRFVLARDA
jgi:ribokinase